MTDVFSYGQDFDNDDEIDDDGFASTEPAPRSRIGTALRRSELGSLPAPESLVSGVMSTPAAVVVIGSYGTGKTALVDGLACSIATGLPWLGRPVQRRRVLLVIGEGAYGKDARLGAWEQCWNAGRPIDDEQMTVIVKPDSLVDPRTWVALRKFATEHDFGFVVFDTFSSLAFDADETKDAPVIMRRLSDLSADINGTAVLVHHPGWSDAARARGGYQFEANADEVLLLTGNPQDDLVCLTRKKVKDGPNGATVWLRRKPVFGSIVMEMARPDEIEAPMRDRLLMVLASCSDFGATGPQLQAELKVEDASRSAFYKALKAAADDGSVTAVGPRSRARYYLPDVAPKGQK